MSTPVIPRSIQEEINNPAMEGGRHTQALKIAFNMIGEGHNPRDVFATLRQMYDASFPDSEINQIIRNAIAKNPRPSTPSNGNSNRANPYRGQQSYKQPKPQKPTIDLVDNFLKKWRCTEQDVIAASPVQIPEDYTHYPSLLFKNLYTPSDFINIVPDCTADGKPCGAGKTYGATFWINEFSKGIPQSQAGAWIRLNPVEMQGSGADGACCDKDVTSFQYLLTESDSLPLDVQLSFLAKSKLPIAAIIYSGGKSYHAWLLLACENAKQYKEQAEKVITVLEPLGFDKANKNPSRMSRLPGAIRKIGAIRDGIQRLIYLNPDPHTKVIL